MNGAVLPLIGPAEPWIKVCGVRSLHDVEASASAGATHVGINAWPRSVRFVPRSERPALARAAMRLGLAAVLVHPAPSDIRPEAIGLSGFRFVQVPHALPAPQAAILRSAGVFIVEARAVLSKGGASMGFGDVLLLDASCGGAPGGTGNTFPWVLAESAPRPFVLAGGLNPDNVGGAVRSVRPCGVDAASGLESAPGIKDAARIGEFCRAAREALQAIRNDVRGGVHVLRSDEHRA